ncbi:MAG: S1/P1 nuclease, partial [Bacteroidota bacterium]
MRSFVVLALFSAQWLFGWGNVGHKLINKNAVIHLPSSMQKLIDHRDFLETHSTDADTRKNTSDTAMFSEQYRHYLDVDEYPDFKNLNRNFSTLVTTYTWARVKGNGTNPWAIVWVMDSLTAQLKRGDTTAAYQSAADLGHYVGDPHQPLHAANNYDGKLTGNTGIHSRYESTLFGKFAAQIVVKKDSVRYINDVYGFAFDFILKSNALADSIFHADNAGKAVSGGTYTAQYYDTLWSRLGDMTKAQIQSATIDLASLWYTAWVNAGLLAKPTGVRKMSSGKLKSFNLEQNYPNPFNPKTTIRFNIAERTNVKLDILSMEGKQIVS